MIPKRLTIEGLYSYKEPQIIDFTKLMSNHLFGIFGAVGSGKSAILEAMMFALYGESDRLNLRGDDRNYNMMNLQSDKLQIDFECIAGETGEEEYRFIFESKRNSKKFEDVKTPGRRVFRKGADGEWIPLEEWSTEKIVGMSYQNFRKTVIIPQGKFKEFLEQKPTDRTKMMQDLFGLDKFDLSNRTTTLISQNKAGIQRVQGGLERLVEFTPEVLENQRLQLKEQEEKKAAQHTALDALRQTVQGMDALKSLFAELKLSQATLEALEGQQPAWKKRENRLDRYLKASAGFQLQIKLQKELQQEKETRRIAMVTLENRIAEFQHQLQTTTQQVEQTREQYDNRDKIRQKCDDLEYIVKIKSLSEALESHQGQLEKDKKDLDLISTKFEEETTAEKQLVKEIETLRLQSGNAIALHQAITWIEKRSEWESKIKDKERKADEGRATLAAFTSGLATMAKDAKLEEKAAEGFEAVLAGLALARRKKEDELKATTTLLRDLQVRQEFARHGADLTEGEACPLCGSVHHPDIAEVEALENEVKATSESLAQIESQLEFGDQLRADLTSSHINWQNATQQQESLLQEIETNTQNLQQHLQAWKWEELTQEESHLRQQIEQASNQESLIRKKSDSLDSIRYQVQLTQEEKQRIDEKVRAIEGEGIKSKAQISTLKENLRVLNWEDLAKHSYEKLADNLKRGRKQFEEIETNYTTQTDKLTQLKQEMSSLQATHASDTSNLADIEQRLTLSQQELDSALEDSNFDSVEEIAALLKLELDVAREKDQLQQYSNDLNHAHKQKAELESRIDGRQFDAALYQSSQQQLTQLEEASNTLNREIGRLLNQVQQSEEQLKQKETLQKQLELLELRATNLETLRKLFHGKGFVEYVSTVYLRNLVGAANDRFMRLTRNNLSLELNDNNDFVVRDYLNNGHPRLLKTLSGGQMFQAALCLALALAGNVTALNKSDHSFFFIDEGFGTLDRNSLTTVFETLKSLREENRIVGVISHVEELQQEIDVHLKIVNDSEQGSLISTNY